MYDWANSAFATTIMAAVLPSFYSTVASSNLDKTLASSYWGYTNTIAMVIIAISAPFLGALSDRQKAKKKFLSLAAAIGIIATATLIFVGKGDWFIASVLYLFARFGFSSANIFYDALLPHIADEKQIDMVSARGYAYGYMGGGLVLAANLFMILNPSVLGIPDSEWAARVSFITVAVWWAIFSIPLLKNVPEPDTYNIKEKDTGLLTSEFHSLLKTFADIRKNRRLFKFLIAFWAYNDGISTIIIMAVIFGTEIGISQTHLIGAILLVQFTGIPFSILFGKLSKKIGSKNSILIALGIYSVITIFGYFMKGPVDFWILAFLVATVQGGTQALSRSMFGALIPKKRSGEYFGFYEVSSKFAGIIGPVTFGAVGHVTGSGRFGILALIIFFIVGAYLLATMDRQN